jgi:hypothetical protein
MSEEALLIARDFLTSNDVKIKFYGFMIKCKKIFGDPREEHDTREGFRKKRYPRD